MSVWGIKSEVDFAYESYLGKILFVIEWIFGILSGLKLPYDWDLKNPPSCDGCMGGYNMSRRMFFKFVYFARC